MYSFPDIILDKNSLNNQINFLEGCLILVDKPLEWTSFDVVNKIRYKLKYAYGIKKIKVGHAGTLDPLATGLLLVCTGKYTKLISELQEINKEYTGTIKIGATTPTYDKESEEDAIFPTDHISKESIENLKAEFIGIQEQMPPIYSAIKISGVEAYKLARRGKEVNMKPRTIQIFDLDLKYNNLSEVFFRILVSKGTYIRSWAHDFGKRLHSGAYLTSLHRTKVGQYQVEDALTIDNITKIIDMLAVGKKEL